MFRIARKTAADRVISTVDTAARHGHKSRNRRFDGYKAHLSVDPDSELIEEVTATAANAPDREAVSGLLHEHAGRDDKPEVIGDSAYGDAATRAGLEEQGFTVVAKCPPARNSGGRFTKDQFAIDPRAGTVTCPAGQTAAIVPPPAAGGPRSGPGARPARCGQRAPPPGAGAPSPSTRWRKYCSEPAGSSANRTGNSSTAPTGPSWNGRSPISPGGRGAGARPEPAACGASPPTWTPAQAL